MKTITSGFRNWKTTIIGITLAVVLIMQKSADLTNWQEWVFPSLIAALGILMRDADKSSEQSGIAKLVIVSASLALLLPSCADFNVTGGLHSDKYGVGGTYSPKGGVNFNVDLDKLIDRNSGK